MYIIPVSYTHLALQYLQEHHLTDYAALTARTEAAVDHFHKLSDKLRTTEEALSKTSELMAATVDYAKTRPVFDGYKACLLYTSRCV